ncbi:MAG: hypothetical protein ACOH5I_08530 [Oligoflexus sp.]
MKSMKYLLIFTFSFCLSSLLMAEESHADSSQTNALSQDLGGDKMVLLAQNQRRQQAKGRQRHLTGEARTSSSKTNIDFEAASIDGERRAPVGVAIGSNKPDHGYDLINLRLRWHPEMIKSTSNLETGRGK